MTSQSFRSHLKVLHRLNFINNILYEALNIFIYLYIIEHFSRIEHIFIAKYQI